MVDMANNSGCTVGVIVKLRPDQYDELIRHVREIGSTMSAFFRESAAKAMKEDHSDRPTLPEELKSEGRGRTFASGCRGL
jgi:hypothetical protein